MSTVPSSGEDGWFDRLAGDLRDHEVERTRSQDRFQRIREIGRGGMGAVFEAWDRVLDRRVALKVMTIPALEGRARFEREARLAARLAHPGVAAVYDFGETDGQAWLALQYVDGTTLDRAGLDPRGAARAVRDAALGVAFAHAHGIVHRDLKPSNVLIDASGRVFVTDFGLARLQGDARLSITGEVLGTPAFMSPEQARAGAVDARSDVWSLGATLHALVSGRPPFEGSDPLAVLERVVRDDPLPLVADRDLVAIVETAMARDPARRYANAALLAEDLTRFLDGRPVTARRRGSIDRIVRRIARRPARVVAAILAAALAGAVGWDALEARRQFDLAERESDLERRLARYERSRRWVGAADDRIEEIRNQLRAREEHLEIFQRALEAWRKVVAFSAGRWRPASAAEEAREARRLAEEANALVERAPAHLLRGRCLEIEGGDPVPAWERALEVDPGYAPARLELARTLLVRYQRNRPLPVTLYEDGEIRFQEIDSDPALRERGEAHLAALGAADLDQGQVELLEGLRAMGTGRYGEAADRLDAWVEREAWDFEATELLGLARYFAQDHERALDAFARVLEMGDVAYVHNLVALCRRALGDLGGALEAYDRAIELEPDRPDPHGNRGSIHHARGDHAAAIADFSRAIELHPAPEWFTDRGVARAHAGDPGGAIDDHTRAIELRPDYALAFHHRGLAREMRSDRLGARADYDRAIEIDPRFHDAYYSRAALRLDAEDLPGAEEDVSRAIALDPRAQDFHLRSVVRSRAGDLERALADLDRALELDPEFALARASRAGLRVQAGDASGAIEDATRALRSAPTADLYNVRANAHLLAGHPELAGPDLDRAVELDPTAPEYPFNRARARLDLGQYPEAAADATLAIDLAPDRPRPYHTRGLARQLRGDLEGAVEDFTRAIERDPAYAIAFAARGQTRAELRRLDEAEADLVRALELGGPEWTYRESVEGLLADVRARRER